MRRIAQGLTVLLLIAACTENPFGGDNTVTGGKREISGSVILSDGSSPEGVVVWLEDFNLSDRADAAGAFHIVLPPKPSGGPTGTVSEHRIFFYLANYALATKQVAVVDGEFFYNRGDIDANGKVRNPVVLHRALRISTEAKPRSDSPTLFEVVVTLQSDAVACAKALNPLIGVKDKLEPVDTLGAVILKNLDTEALTIVRSTPQSNGNEVLVVCKTPLQRKLPFDAVELALPPGPYLAIPYILIEPEDVPLGLLAIIGSQVNGLNAGYLQKPMRREGGFFEVR